ncbi:nuclear transcription factor Y subunit C-1 isoform X2 [Amaranthus tricolor]|uniref:nuclear transcription factor Y subunit C-1 isoform X2 n=1 Tax=Amaranthus tricolor TaxID=29722 RepID=UPI00258463D4|nr:nuclear transcription factor Y subunit C-1 isoform X2 [Amaranthus tricolor]
MEGNQQPPQPQPSQPPLPQSTAGYPPPTPHAAQYHHLLQQQQQQLQMFWSYQRQEIENANDFKNHQLPLARIKKIMKADEDVRMISAEAPILFAKACELFILELTIRSWLHAEENKRRTLQKNDIAAAITRTDIFDFLVDIVPRDEIKDEAAGLGMMAPTGIVPPTGIVGPSGVGPTASGVPYYYPPMGQPAPGVMIGRPAVDPTGAAGMYATPPSTAWQNVWQGGHAPGDDGSYGSAASAGGNSAQGNLDAHS